MIPASRRHDPAGRRAPVDAVGFTRRSENPPHYSVPSASVVIEDVSTRRRGHRRLRRGGIGRLWTRRRARHMSSRPVPRNGRGHSGRCRPNSRPIGWSVPSPSSRTPDAASCWSTYARVHDPERPRETPRGRGNRDRRGHRHLHTAQAGVRLPLPDPPPEARRLRRRPDGQSDRPAAPPAGPYLPAPRPLSYLPRGF